MSPQPINARAHHSRTHASLRTAVARPKPAAAANTTPAHTVKRINDVVRAVSKSHVVSPRPAKQAMTIATSTAAEHKHGAAPHHVKAHTPERAKTLMRAAVSRPDASLRRRAKAQTRTDILVKSPEFAITPKQSSQSLDTQRLKRAEHVGKSQLIRHFASEPTSWLKQQLSPAPIAGATSAAPHATTPRPAAKSQRSMDIFQRALATATSHEQPKVKPERAPKQLKAPRQPRQLHRHLLSTVAASLAVVLLAGFFAYQNQAAITLRFASAKAGFHATLPGYKPAGYATGKFHYSAGSVAVQYARSGTSRAYTVSQQVSSLDSQSLLENTIKPHASTYQTLQQGGRTIYIYGDGNAAWVDGGILYQITSQGNLSTSDILGIATSV
jgi:hypothetical protein